ncbi:MAG: hypothetical protein AAEJ52_19285 [Myxococcota bacterium]
MGESTSDVDGVSSKLGADPVHCAQLPDQEICTWHLRARGEHIVCYFDVTEPSVNRPCLRTNDNLSMLVFPQRRFLKVTGLRPTSRQLQLSEEAKQQLDDSSTLEAVVKLIGAGPIWCRKGDALVCGWHAVRRTPGYITLARIAGAPGKKLAVVCRFAPDGLAREPGSCRVFKSSRPPIERGR